MGSKMETTYATLTLSYLEENLYQIIGKKIWQQPVMEKILGDCFIFWKCPWGGDINKLHNLFQNLQPKIKFTMEHSSEKLLFF